MKHYCHPSELIASGEYFTMRWDDKMIFVERVKQRFRNLYIYNEKYKIAVLYSAVDMHQGLEGGLEEVLDQ